MTGHNKRMSSVQTMFQKSVTWLVKKGLSGKNTFSRTHTLVKVSVGWLRALLVVCNGRYLSSSFAINIFNRNLISIRLIELVTSTKFRTNTQGTIKRWKEYLHRVIQVTVFLPHQNFSKFFRWCHVKEREISYKRHRNSENWFFAALNPFLTSQVTSDV